MYSLVGLCIVWTPFLPHFFTFFSGEALQKIPDFCTFQVDKKIQPWVVPTTVGWNRSQKCVLIPINSIGVPSHFFSIDRMPFLVVLWPISEWMPGGSRGACPPPIPPVAVGLSIILHFAEQILTNEFICIVYLFTY